MDTLRERKTVSLIKNVKRSMIIIISKEQQQQQHVYDAYRYWQTRTHCCGHIVVSMLLHVAQTGNHLLRTRNLSDQNQKHFLCLGHKICVRNKCCARGQTGKHLCPQQCVRNNVYSFASTLPHTDKCNSLFVCFF